MFLKNCLHCNLRLHVIHFSTESGQTYRKFMLEYISFSIQFDLVVFWVNTASNNVNVSRVGLIWTIIICAPLTFQCNSHILFTSKFSVKNLFTKK